MSDPGNKQAAQIAARLDFLFARIYPRRGRPQTNEEVSLATGISVTDLEKLRAGVSLDQATGAEVFVSRLDFLLKTRLTESGKRHTLASVAKACGKTRVWLFNLRAGKSKPTLESTVLLCDVFMVDSTFFTDEPLQALARHFGVEAGVGFFTLPEKDTPVQEAKRGIELLVQLRELGADAVLNRYLGTLPETKQ
ncbi:hypothetical protein ABT246_24865 [Streptomyces sp. NPDC001553]|uniref:hypothetical protein n=1 Tax=Streptomyces sp. NPDC001553 TaxID=3154385 RepID=UPI0033291330